MCFKFLHRRPFVRRVTELFRSSSDALKNNISPSTLNAHTRINLKWNGIITFFFPLFLIEFLAKETCGFLVDSWKLKISRPCWTSTFSFRSLLKLSYTTRNYVCHALINRDLKFHFSIFPLFSFDWEDKSNNWQTARFSAKINIRTQFQVSLILSMAKITQNVITELL